MSYIVTLAWCTGTVYGRTGAVALARHRQAASQQDESALVGQRGRGFKGGMMAATRYPHLGGGRKDSGIGCSESYNTVTDTSVMVL